MQDMQLMEDVRAKIRERFEKQIDEKYKDGLMPNFITTEKSDLMRRLDIALGMGIIDALVEQMKRRNEDAKR